MTEEKTISADPDAREIISRFGGIRPMARLLDSPATTIQGWHKRNAIPASRMKDIRRLAAENDVNLDLSEGSLESGEQPKPQSAGIRSIPDFMTAPVPGPAPATTDEEDSYMNSTPEPTTAHKDRPTESCCAPVHEGHNGSRKGSGVFLNLVVSVVASVGVLIAASFFWAPEVEKISAVPEKVSSVEQEIATVRKKQDDLSESLHGRLAVLEESVRKLTGGLQTLESDMTAFTDSPELSGFLSRFDEFRRSLEEQNKLQGAMDELRGLMGSVQGRVESLGMSLEEVQKLGTPLGRTLDGIPREQLQGAVMLLGVAQFRDSLEQDNQPFGTTLSLLQELAGPDHPELAEAIDKLSPYADTGVLTPQSLSQELQRLSGEALSASLKDADTSLTDRAMAGLGSVLTVKKDGRLLTGTEEQSLIVRAQSALDMEDLSAALAALRDLKGPAAEVLQPVLRGVKQTLLARKVRDMASEVVTTMVNAVPLQVSAPEPVVPQEEHSEEPSKVEPQSGDSWDIPLPVLE